MRSDRGSVTIWTLGLSVLLLLFGGLMVDFWRALALQRELAAIADSTAVAAASGIDEEHYRATGEVLLDPTRAAVIGARYVGSQDVSLSALAVTTAQDGSSVTVEVIGQSFHAISMRSGSSVSDPTRRWPLLPLGSVARRACLRSSAAMRASSTRVLNGLVT